MGACACILYAAVDPSISVSTPSPLSTRRSIHRSALSIARCECASCTIGAYPRPAQHSVLCLMLHAPYVATGCVRPSGRVALIARGVLTRYSHGTDLCTGRARPERPRDHLCCLPCPRGGCAFVCVYGCLCVFACAGNGARLARELANGAGGRSRRPAAAGASAPSSSCDAPPLPRGPSQNGAVWLTGTPRCAAPSSCRCRAVMCDHPRVPPRLSYSAAVCDRSTSARCPCIARLEGRARARHLRLAAAVRARACAPSRSCRLRA